MRSSQLLAAVLLALSTLAVSSPDPFGREIVPRATTASTTSATSTGGRATGPAGDGIFGNETPASSPDPPTDSGSPSDTGSGSGSDSQKSTTAKKVSSKTSSIRIPATALAGSVTMKTPSVADGYQIYKIGETLTFVWNYTDVKVTPAAINVLAWCQDAAQFFTIVGNGSGTMTSATWDTGKYLKGTVTERLLVATYTLNIFDAARGTGAAASAGYLQRYSGLQFGMYTPREYKSLKDFECPTCDPNGANAAIDKYTLRMALGMGMLAVASFTWFLVGNQLY